MARTFMRTLLGQKITHLSVLLASTIALSVGMPNGARAGESSYECVIKKIYDIDDGGMLKISGFQRHLEGGEFSVSRETGKIVGQTLTTILSLNTNVINKGSEENSFKAVARFHGQIQLIEIQEFRKGSEKPFVAFSMGGAGIVTGICQLS